MTPSYYLAICVAYRKNTETLRNKTLLIKLGISLNTLQNCKAELIKYGYLKVIRKTSANKYELAIPNKVVLPYPNFGQPITQKWVVLRRVILILKILNILKGLRN